MSLSDSVRHDEICLLNISRGFECDCIKSKVAKLEEENGAFKRVTGEFGGYEVSKLLKVIAEDYRSYTRPSSHIVMEARSMWLIDFADALFAAEGASDK